MEVIKKFFGKEGVFLIVCILFGCLFSFSGVTKVIAVEDFELFVFNSGLVSWRFTELVSRIVIITELILGLWFFVAIFSKQKQPFWLGALLILFFTLMLIFSLVKKGNEADCGCFGGVVEMNTTSSIIKNVISLVLLGLTIVSYDFSVIKKKLFFNVGLLVCLALFSAAVMLANPIRNILVNREVELTNQNIEDSPLAGLSDSTLLELTNKEQWLVFVSPTCPHCLRFVKELNRYYEKGTVKDISLVFGEADQRLINIFLEKSGNKIEHHIIDRKIHALVSEGRVPGVSFIGGGKLVGLWREGDFNPEMVIQLDN